MSPGAPQASGPPHELWVQSPKGSNRDRTLHRSTGLVSSRSPCLTALPRSQAPEGHLEKPRVATPRPRLPEALAGSGAEGRHCSLQGFSGVVVRGGRPGQTPIEQEAGLNKAQSGHFPVSGTHTLSSFAEDWGAGGERDTRAGHLSFLRFLPPPRQSPHSNQILSSSSCLKSLRGSPARSFLTRFSTHSFPTSSRRARPLAHIRPATQVF